ncbi:MAG: serine aminopeptidase domain-containing protein [Coprobacillaceae bacterium]
MKYSATFTSCTNTHIHYDLYLPTVMIRYKAVVQVHHGMGEYAGRYVRFAEFLAKEGYVVVVSEFPGHGSSLHDFEQGYFGIGDPGETLVNDVQRLRNIITRRFADLPYFMLGNQLGSYILRQYISMFGDFIQGVILMGTIGKDSNPWIEKSLLAVDAAIKGKMHRSKTIKKRLENRWNNKFMPIKTKVDYLTSDPQERKRYEEDPMTNFTYTNKAYQDIFRIMKNANNQEWIKRTPEYMSIFIISGKKDIFGGMGNGPRWLYEQYKLNGVRDLEIQLYPDSRHDILHERNRKAVYQDILTWLNERTYI